MLLITDVLCFVGPSATPVHCSFWTDVLMPLLRAQIHNTEINYEGFLASSIENVFSCQRYLFLVTGFSAFEGKTKPLTCVFCNK